MIAPNSMVTPTIRLVRQLGQGGMGSVWLAQHLALSSQVVVKFMTQALLDDPMAVARFTREASAASQVRSPHVVQVLDHGVTHERVPYIVMEYLEGCDLRARLVQRRRLGLEEVELILTQVCRALSRAHEKGIVHRDIKPENIFLCDHGGDEPFVKLLDFGIAKGTETIGAGTKTGALIGSPLYMSPEQLVGAKSLDHRTDLWSLGIVVFEALTGDCPFDADTLGAMTLLVHGDERPRLTWFRPDLPPAFDAWFVRACAKDPNARFASAKDLRDAFAAVVAEARAFAGSASPPIPHAARPTVDAGTISPLQTTAHRAPAKTAGSRAALLAGMAAGMVTVALAIGGVALSGHSKQAAPAAPPSSDDPAVAAPERGSELPVAPGDPTSAAASSAAPAPPAVAPVPSTSATVSAGAASAPPRSATPRAPNPAPPSSPPPHRSKHGSIF
jgi:serine/threonine-protein kinase